MEKLRNLQAKGAFKDDEVTLIFLGKFITDSCLDLRIFRRFWLLFYFSGSSSDYLARRAKQGVDNLRNMFFILNHEENAEKTSIIENHMDSVRFVDTNFTLLNQVNRFLQEKICQASGKGKFIAQTSNSCYICRDCGPDSSNGTLYRYPESYIEKGSRADIF